MYTNVLYVCKFNSHFYTADRILLKPKSWQKKFDVVQLQFQHQIESMHHCDHRPSGRKYSDGSGRYYILLIHPCIFHQSLLHRNTGEI